jgi:hypothetical protein
MDPQAFSTSGRGTTGIAQDIVEAGILLAGEAVGGGKARTVRLEIGSGRLWLQSGGRRAGTIIPPERSKHMAYRVLITDDSQRCVRLWRVIELSGFELGVFRSGRWRRSAGSSEE